MAKQDYIPNPDAGLVAWHDNFNTQVAALAATFGLVAADTAAVAATNTDLHAKFNTSQAAKATAQAKNTEKSAAFAAGISSSRALAKRIKTHPAYTAAFGQQLGIIGPEDTTDLTQAKPTHKLLAVTPGSVTIGFNKSVSSGVRLLSKRGAETAFTFLAIDTESPYIDTRANLVVGVPESRQYQAQYLIGDEPVGNLSNALNVTVPG
ncbi:MAG: hypothetical protein O3A00_11935 [Planctomycetota bacterium]|nr:hypothetical protein [Planctomycetota bacterium]